MLRAALGVLLLFSSQVLAEDAARGPEETRGLNNFHTELLTCANYFLLVQRCVANTPGVKQEVATGYGNSADVLIARSMVVGEMLGMTQDAMRSRMKMEGDALMSLVNGDCVNISSAMTRYMERCITVSNSGDAVLTEHLDRARRN